MAKRKADLTAAEIIKKRRLSAQTKSGYKSLLIRVILIALVLYLIFTQMLLITQKSGNDMFPAIKDGDLILAYRLQQDYAQDDVIVYTVNGVRKVGRIVACGSDIITIDDETGTLYVNGTEQSGEILYPTYSEDELTYPFTVPSGYVFVMCDYRTQGTDSRTYGAIPLDNVEGKVITILRRRGL